MASLTSRLRSLVRESKDPFVVAYVIENLGRVSLDPTYGQHIGRLRGEYASLLYKMYWQPAEAERGPAARKFKFDDPFGGGKTVSAKEVRALLRATDMKMMAQKVLKRQMDEQTESLQVLYREFNEEDTLGIVVRLKDEEPLNRWMAVQIAQDRWEKVENFLVELLEDPAPPVRHAAHQALVKLSRGTDHGPSGVNPSTTQIRGAQKLWRAYLEIQDAVR